jgi:hypothetical protein
MKILSEVGDVLELQSNGSRTVVSALEFFRQALSKLVIITPKRDDPLYPLEQLTVLPPQSGFVQRLLATVTICAGPTG